MVKTSISVFSSSFSQMSNEKSLLLLSNQEHNKPNLKTSRLALRMRDEHFFSLHFNRLDD